MKSAWVEGEAQAAITQYAGHGADVALRVYTTRLLGRDPALVLHGSGNRLYAFMDVLAPVVLLAGAFAARKKLGPD